MLRTLKTVGLSALVALVGAAPAAATTRYVVRQNGVTSGTCEGTPGNPPCQIDYAFSLQTDGDQYVIGPGIYATQLLLGVNGLDVHGIPGQPTPEITADGTATFGTETLYVVNGSGDRFSDLAITTDGNNGVAIRDDGGGNTFDQVAITATGPSGGEGAVSAFITGPSDTLSHSTIAINESGGTPGAVQIAAGKLTIRHVTIAHEDNFEIADVALQTSQSVLNADGLRLTGPDGGLMLRNGSATVTRSVLPLAVQLGGSSTITDSLLTTDSGPGVADAAGAMTLRNDTIVSTGTDDDAIDALASGGGATILATNVIAVPGPGGIALNASAGNAIDVDHSDFPNQAGTVTELAGNLHANPQFVNPLSDFHLQPTSPAVDAGTSAGIPNTETDLDGNLRVPPKGVDCTQRVDMGAYELTGHDHPCPPLAPRLTQVRQTNSRWRAANRQATVARSHSAAPIGTAFEFTLDQQARVTLAFTREGRTHPAGSLSLPAHRGDDRILFYGKINGAISLGPGSYTVVITATNAAGERSNQARLSFTIVPG